MRVTKISVCTVLLALMSAAGVSQAEESALGIDVSADFYGKYIWRGQNLVDDWVFQPGVNFAYGNLSAGIWGNSDMHGDAGDNQDWEFTELDYYADYSSTVPGADWLGYSVGVIYYYFPGSVEETTEVYWGFSVDTLLSPSVTVYHDVDEADGTYVSFGIGHSIEQISDDLPVGVDVGLSVGWGDSDYNEFYWGSGVDSELNDLALQVAFPVAMGSWSVTPSINYVALLGDDVSDSNAYHDDDDYLFCGVSLSTSF